MTYDSDMLTYELLHLQAMVAALTDLVTSDLIKRYGYDPKELQANTRKSVTEYREAFEAAAKSHASRSEPEDTHSDNN